MGRKQERRRKMQTGGTKGGNERCRIGVGRKQGDRTEMRRREVRKGDNERKAKNEDI